MENLFFEAFLYIAVFCFLCCFCHDPNRKEALQYQPIDLSPIWEDAPDDLPELDGMNSRQLRLLASTLKLPGYSRILRERKTEGLRQSLKEYLKANGERSLNYNF